MDIIDIIEQARAAGVVTNMTIPASEVPDAERVDGFDWDVAYPHVLETV